MSRRLPLALLAVAPVLALAACGGEDRLSAAEYRAQLSQTCRAGDAAIERLGQPRPTASGLATFVEGGIRATRPIVDRAAALVPPEELQADHDRFIAIGRETLEVSPRLVTQIRGATTVQAAARAIQDSEEGRRLDQIDRESDQLAQRLGVPACADD